MMTDTPIDRPRAGQGLFLAMAVGCGIAVANLYYNQPLLALMAADLGISTASIGLVPTATQIGYAVGLFFLVPLGDMFDRRRLIVLQSLLLALALAAMAVAPGFAVIIAASVVIGIAATIAQQIIPFAATLADEHSRGRVLGLVMAGLLAGILLARTVAGFIGEYLGWRATYVVAVALTALLGIMAARLLPRAAPAASRTGYGALMASIVGVARRHPLLVKSSLVQACQFWCFSAFWSTLALYLEGPDFRLGADVAGLFGALAVVGVLAAPLAGRLADRRGPGLVIVIGLVCTALSFLGFALLPGIWVLVVGVLLFDFGVQLSMVAHQTRIFALDPGARSRINTVFMTTLFTSGAISSAVASSVFASSGWVGVALLGLGVSLLGLALHSLWRPQR